MHSPRSAPPSKTSPFAVALIVAVFAAAGALLHAPAPAVASGLAVAGAMTAPASLSLPVTPLAARGGGFGRPRISPNRPSSRNRPVTRRNPNTGRALRNVSRTLLRALGIAFLLSFLFGIGPGGSPLGLLLLLGLVALVVVVARRRRRQHGYR
jgi:MYXO-CTERM domain-containing protein